MFFAVSKIFWIVASPVALLLILAVLGTVLSWRRRALIARLTALASLVILAAIALTPIGFIIVAPLEDRFPKPPDDMAAPYGIIVPGGSLNDEASRTRGMVVFGEEGQRAVQAAILAKRYPEAKLIFTGGSGSIFSSDNTEARQALRLWIELGVDPSRIILEEKSRNTDENARFTAAAVHPKPDERWLLVTSAWHMPRSMGLFEKAGFNVTAYPVAQRTLGPGAGSSWDLDPARNLRIVEIATKEWIGLVAYRLTGRIDKLFPGPRNATVAASSG